MAQSPIVVDGSKYSIGPLALLLVVFHFFRISPLSLWMGFGICN